MANTQSFSIDSITADRLEGVLLDETVYASPLRSAVAVFVKGEKIKENDTVYSTLTLEGDDLDPETDSQWTFDIPLDGWFRFLIVEIPYFNAASTYAIYDAVYQTSTGNVYRSKQNGNTTDTLTDGTWWEEITDPATLASNYGEANESTNITSSIYEPGIFPNSEYNFANEIANASEEYLTSSHIPDDNLDTYSLLALLVDGEYVNSDRSQMNQAERIARRFESLIESLNN